MIIPIVLLHYNEPELLLKCVVAIKERTRFQHILFVVDNDSPKTARVDEVLQLISTKYSVIVLNNKKNNWIYGFNLALQSEYWPISPYYAFSDSDVIVPERPTGDPCWLEHLVIQLDQYRCIGKIGLSLNLDNLALNPALQPTLMRESAYMAGPKIGPNIIAPVDTTMALYRNDLFIVPFKMQVGHASLVKPYYYICRTSQEFNALHLGWDYYPGAMNGEIPKERLWKKTLSFSRMGAIVDPAILAQFNLLQRIYAITILYRTRLFFGARICWLTARYVLRNFPRRLNEVQSRAR